jgi:hypothetical protein
MGGKVLIAVVFIPGKIVIAKIGTNNIGIPVAVDIDGVGAVGSIGGGRNDGIVFGKCRREAGGTVGNAGVRSCL